MPTWFQHGLSQVNRRQADERGDRGDSVRPGQVPHTSTADSWVAARVSPRPAPAGLQDTLAHLVRPAAPPAQRPAPQATTARQAHEAHEAHEARQAHDGRQEAQDPRQAHDGRQAQDARQVRDGQRAPEARPAPDAERVPATAANGSAASNGSAAANGSAARRSRAGTLRLGVVGVGYWGAKHVRALEKVDGVSAVVAIDQRLADEPNGSLAALGIDQYGDLKAALPHVDAVVIATPPSTHTAIGLQAIAAGKHVLIEKPLATSSSEARSLITAADAAGVVLMSGHTFEHNAAVHKLRELVRGRDLGQLYYLDCARLNLGLYRDDVGVIADLAPHDISIANYVLSSRPTSVTAWGSRFIGPEHEDVAFLRLDYGDIGVRASIQVSWLSPVKVRRITAVGSQRMAVYDDLAEDERIRIYDKSAVPAARTGGEQRMTYHTGDTVMPYVEFAEPLAVQDQEFVSCIRTGRTPDADGNSGLSVVQVLDAAQMSMREQRPVSIAELNQAQAGGTPLRIAGDPPLRSA